MSKWDDANFEPFRDEKPPDHEEIRLLRKFEDYRELEKKELEKRESPIQSKEKTGVWTNRFVFLTIIQAIIITGFTLSLMLMESVNSDIKMLVMLLTLGVLTGEIVFVYKYLQKKSWLIFQNVSGQFKMKTEFDVI
ncbi:MAG: hypothetical protein ACREAL_05580 [Nitrosopumilaceae archaeon]